MTQKIINWLLEWFGTEIRAMHELKSWPAEFEALTANEKRHEVRRCDRDYQPGDWLLLREWYPETEQYSGRQLFREITHITPPGAFGLPEGICVMSVK